MLRKTGVALVLLALLAGTALAAQSGKPRIRLEGDDGRFVYKPKSRHDGVPCLSYVTPDAGGEACFTAVGLRGGWALEALDEATEHDTVVYGATIGAAARVRIGRVATIKTGRYRPNLKVRFFAAVVPRRALRVKPNRIVALDRHGRLLGRQHYNDGHGGFGRCDGRWDRRHFCPKPD
jgi:hypothetical protein